jgi:hypothetical protein
MAGRDRVQKRFFGPGIEKNPFVAKPDEPPRSKLPRSKVSKAQKHKSLAYNNKTF